MLHSELVPLLQKQQQQQEDRQQQDSQQQDSSSDDDGRLPPTNDRFDRLVAGSIESPLGIMLAALGGGDELSLSRHAALGISSRLLVLPEHALTINTGVMVFSCAAAKRWRLFEAMVRLAERCAEVGIAPLLGDVRSDHPFIIDVLETRKIERTLLIPPSPFATLACPARRVSADFLSHVSRASMCSPDSLFLRRRCTSSPCC